MTFFRWIVGLPMAAIVTAGLFFMMAGLIEQKSVDYPDPTPYPDIRITSEPPDERQNLVDRYKETRLKEKQPDTEIERTPPTDGPGKIFVPTPRPPIDPMPGGRGTGFPQPVITFAPPYPENCRSRAAEGTVTVQFDVTAEGNVVNPRIIQTVDRCFNRTVIRTVSKWKYPPATKGGRSIMRRGVTTVIRFELRD